MRGLVSWWAKNGVAANLLMVAILLMGIVGFNKLEREFFPTLTVNGMTVSVVWQGASPKDIEEQLITRIEDAVQGLDGIDYIEATAREGSGQVNIRTKVRADYDKILSEVKVRVDGINNFPPDIFRPTVIRWEARADYMYLALHGDMDRLTLQRLTNDIRKEMAKIPGGELIQDISKLEEEVTIEISETALRRFGLTFREVASAISGSSVNLSAGTVKTSSGNLQMKARNLADSKSQFENIIIRQTQDGGKVYLRDIARIHDGFEDYDFVATYDGETATMFQVTTPDIMNVTKAGKGFREYIAQKNQELPPGVTLSMWFDGSTVFDSRMNLIGSNALLGMVLVLIILVLFLRPAVALWVTIGIMVSFAGAIAVMPYLGVSLNMISTFAILLVIGIVVDDAIVVGESIHFHVEHGITGEKGAIAGTNMVIKPVFFAVITTIMTFMPWML
ncbi:MAG: efflux RND transporter permease subunit, partial [Robiginitomaculum sp.]|nr:efflux RND transporter permease subunit [Robiginitomaculum sp.]